METKPTHSAASSVTLASFVETLCSLRNAARVTGVPAATLHALLRGRSKAAPDTVTKLALHNIEFESLVERCTTCNSIKIGTYCPQCSSRDPRRKVPVMSFDPDINPNGFYLALLDNMQASGCGRPTLEGVALVARGRGVPEDRLRPLMQPLEELA